MEERESLINVITEELRCCSELGYGYHKTAENVISIIEGNLKHLQHSCEDSECPI